MKTHKVLPVELLQIKSGYDTDQDWFSVVRRDFTVRYENPKQDYRRIYTKVKPSNNYPLPLSKLEVSKTISVFLICIDKLNHLISWKSSICPGLESKKTFLNRIFFWPKFASKVAPKVSPKPPAKDVSLFPQNKIHKAVRSNFPTKHPSSVPTSHLVVSLWLYIFGICCS